MIRKKIVFLSSAQYENEFIEERSALPFFFQNQPICSFFELWRVEDYASPDEIGEHCEHIAAKADILIMLLGKDIRPAVRREYEAASKNNRDIFVFIKKGCAATSELTTFINSLYSRHSVVEYAGVKELTRKIEDSFFGHYLRGPQQIDKESPYVKLLPLGDRRERGLRLLVGILSTDVAAATEAKVYESLVEEALLDGGEGKNEDTVLGSVARCLDVQSDIIKSRVENAIRALKAAGVIQLTPDNRFILEQNARQRNNKLRANADSKEESLLKGWYDKRSPEIEAVGFLTYKKILLGAISAVIHESAVVMSEIPLHGDKSPFAYDAETLNQYVAQALLTGENLPGRISTWQNIVIDILLSEDSEAVGWFNLLRKGYWILATAGRDPDAINCAAEHLKSYCIYFDSHLVIRAMIGAGGEFQMCNNILRLSSKLGVESRLSQVMYSEVETAFAGANKAFFAVRGDISRAIDFFKTINRKTDIFDGFLYAKAKNPAITWESFMSQFYSIRDPRVLGDYITNELGVTVCSKQDFSEEQLGRIEELVELLMQERRIPAMPLDSIDKHHRRKWEAQYLLRTNEARQMAIVYEKRQIPDRKGIQYWFVSFDTFVYEVSAELATTGDGLYSFPCYMKPGRWLDILVNASPAPLNINTFREILLSPAVKHAADYIESEVIVQMLQARVDKEIRHLETLEHMFDDIVNRQAVKDAFEEVQQAKRGPKAFKAVERAKDTIISALSDEVSALRKEIEGKEKTAEEAVKKADKEHKRAKYYKAELRRQIKGKKKKK